MTGDPADSFIIRLARLEELPRLTEIELDAFATLADARGGSREAHALPESLLRQSLDDDLLFVAADKENQPIAFLAGTQSDEMLYIREIDVARAWQRKGVGRRLMATAIETARASRLRGVTLTTDRFVSFNAPFMPGWDFRKSSTATLSLNCARRCTTKSPSAWVQTGVWP